MGWFFGDGGGKSVLEVLFPQYLVAHTIVAGATQTEPPKEEASQSKGFYDL